MKCRYQWGVMLSVHMELGQFASQRRKSCNNGMQTSTVVCNSGSPIVSALMGAIYVLRLQKSIHNRRFGLLWQISVKHKCYEVILGAVFEINYCNYDFFSKNFLVMPFWTHSRQMFVSLKKLLHKVFGRIFVPIMAAQRLDIFKERTTFLL